MACWRGRSTHGQRAIAVWRCPRSCVRATTRGSRPGESNEPENEPESVARTCFPPHLRGGGLPEELRSREARRERIRAARARLEEEKGEKLADRHQKSFADLDANMMKTGEGSLTYCYNAQAAVSEDGFIVATEVSTTPRDEASLEPVLDEIEAHTGEAPGRVLADKGYLTEQSLEAMEKRQQKCLIAVGREGKRSRWPGKPRSRKMHRILRLPWAQELYRHRKTQGERPFA